MEDSRFFDGMFTSVKNFGSNIKSRVSPTKVKSGTMSDRRVRVYKHKNYDQKVTTYKIVTYIPKEDI